MALLSEAIQEERWDVAALCLLIGLLRSTLEIPEDALPGLLEALEGETNGTPK